jgi:uncharacterized protein
VKEMLVPLRVWLFMCLASWSWLVTADVSVPTLNSRVTDVTGTLTPQQLQTLERTLQTFESRKGSQIAVLIVPTTESESIEQYSLRVVEHWKLGRKNIDDGVLLLIAKNDHTLRIEVGYGLEGALTDATCKRIISEIIVPQFKQGNYYGGIQSGLNSIIKVVNGEALPSTSSNFAANTSKGQMMVVLFVAMMFVGSVLPSIFGSVLGGLLTGGVVAYLAFFLTGSLLIAIIAGVIATLFGFIGNNSSKNHTYSSSRHRRNSFGSGGFGGGGGGFGGGGASGRW